jgi:cytochrome c peroxidase
MLDNPYAVALDPNTPGNDQGWPSYRTNVIRRPAFGVTLPQFLVHPLNYNPNIGEEMRLLNPAYAGGPWRVLDTECSTAPTGSTCIRGLVRDPVDPTRYTSLYKPVTVSPGLGRVTETSIDSNSPFKPDTTACVATTELFPVPEGSIVCGGDVGEPGYAGPGVVVGDTSTQYSVPGVPASTKASTIGRLLHDPERGDIQPRNATTGAGGLRKPSLRIPEVGGSPPNPNYLYNSLANTQARAAAAGQPAAQAAAFIAPSNENDYVKDRTVAAALGKALFWDMQIGSDGVQSCGTCHFNAGADDRTKNQLNPNHLGGDLTFQLHPPNGELVTSDFPFHKLADPDIAGDPACTTPLVANISAVVPAPVHPVAGNVTVCAASNIVSDVNDVASSMGVVFSPFTDIPTPGSGAFVQVRGAAAVKPVAPDVRSFLPAPVLDAFNRADTTCAVGLGAPWTGTAGAYQIQGNQARSCFDGFALWHSFGADQEVYFTFTNVSTTASEQDLLLKATGPTTGSTDAGNVIEVQYNAATHQVLVNTIVSSPPAGVAAQGWVTRATFNGVTFANTDVFRARAHATGLVEVFKSGTVIGTANVTSGPNPWPAALAAGGGKVGVWFMGGAAGAQFDGFGGGTITAASAPLDPIPGFQGLRRVEPRNTPTFFLAAQNFDNFWDGRARHDFNGGSVFGVADPQSHVFVTALNSTGAGVGDLAPTRQVIRFASLASLATGPGLSEFEMSFLGRNWSKIGKKVLQAGVVPLANQLVDPTDSVLGPYSNQPGNPAAATAPGHCSAAGMNQRAAGKPGLCLSYNELIKAAFHTPLHANTATHLNGCYTDGRTPACVGIAPDPFDGYVLTPAAGPAVASNTNQFTQMEGNFSLFWGLGLHIWVTLLVPDDTPLDKFLDANPEAGFTLGEPGEPGLVGDIRLCSENGGRRPCLTELGNFKRDAGLTGHFGGTAEGTPGAPFPSNGTRRPGDPDPLLGLDLFQGSNLSLKNPSFRSARCGECHQGGMLTDNNFDRTHLVTALDFAAEFNTPGVELVVEPLGRPRLISGFLLEAELNENGQDALERRFINQSIVPSPVDGLAYPEATANGPFGPWTGAGSAFIDNGVYNLGVRPISEDIGRGGDDAFGWPLSLTALAMKNVAGPTFEPGNVMPNFDPDREGFGVFEQTAQDQQINPGLESHLIAPLLPPHIAPWVNNITVGDAHPELDEAGGAPGGMYNTLTDVPMLEGFIDSLGPHNPAAVINEAYTSAAGPFMGTWPVPNRVIRNGAFKAPQLREVELTGPYFHNGGKLTLRQVVDFYARGGDFPITNGPHRDFNIVNLRLERQSNLTEEEIVSLVDFLLELTDERVRFERAPFDHPEVFVPLDGRAPDNTFGRPGFVQRLTGDCKGIAGAGPCFKQSPATGAAGRSTPVPAFLGVTRERVAANDPVRCNPANGPISHYCH